MPGTCCYHPGSVPDDWPSAEAVGCIHEELGKRKKKKKKAQFLFNNTQLYSCQNIFFLDLNNHTFNLTMQTNFSFHLDFAFYMYLFLSYKLHASLVLLQVFSQLFCPEAKGFLQVLYQPVSSSKPVAVLPIFL